MPPDPPSMNWLTTPLRILSTTSGAVCAAASGYLAVLTAAAVPHGRLRARSTGASAGVTRFAILVPAHDEGAIIARAVESLAQLDYPTDRYSVHVIADNCSDRTAEIARAAGAVVHERHDEEHPGKGEALNWAVGIIANGPDAPDAFAVVDADTEVHVGFLSAMDDAVTEGALAAQGHYGVLEHNESPAQAFRSAALACRHHVRPLGRNRLGASCGLYGNGMVFTSPTLAERRWTSHLVEDAEFQMELLLDGIPVRYVPEAHVRAEMPESLDGSITQNQRWERGRIEVARRYVPILAQSLRFAPRGRRAALVDAIADHLVPPLSILASAHVVAVSLSAADALVSRRRSGALPVSLAAAALFGAHVIVSLVLVGAPRSTYASLARAPRAILWKSRLWMSTVRTDDVAWQRTPRNAAHAPEAAS